MKYDIVVIGGGLVGLATALKVLEQRPGLKLAVLEKESLVAGHQSGNNSGVIHSGIYYKPGSQKAKNCLAGREKLLEFCRQNNIKHELCGKLIVASAEREIPGLNKLYEQGILNGLVGIIKLSAEELKIYEPNARGVAGILVPQTGIVDFKEVAEAYALAVKKNGGEIFFNYEVSNILRKNGSSFILSGKEALETRKVINCAGLYSDKIALFNRPSLSVRIVPFRGEFYKLLPNAAGMVKNLIYPVPNSSFPFLGVHLSRKINGEIWAGPNAVFAFRREGYKFFDFKAKEFLQSIFWLGLLKLALRSWKFGAGEFYRSWFKSAFVKNLNRLLPEIKQSDLVFAGAGVRAQAVGKDGVLIDDFLVLEDEFQIDVLNAPSPAATASLAIGEEIARKALLGFE